MTLKFRIHVEDVDSPSIFEKWSQLNKFPSALRISELDLLSMIRMSRARNKDLHERLVEWYGKIDQNFRLI